MKKGKYNLSTKLNDKEFSLKCHQNRRENIISSKENIFIQERKLYYFLEL